MLLHVRTAARDRCYALVKLYLIRCFAPNDLLFTAVHAVFDDSHNFVMLLQYAIAVVCTLFLSELLSESTRATVHIENNEQTRLHVQKRHDAACMDSGLLPDYKSSLARLFSLLHLASTNHPLPQH